MNKVGKLSNNLLEKLRNYEYNIYIKPRELHLLFENESKINSFLKIKNPLFYWIADPFLVESNNDVYVFAEAANKITRKGKIVFGKYKKGKIHWKTCYKSKTHLSFPFIYKNNDGYHLIPENSEQNMLYSLKSTNLNNWNIDKIFTNNKKCVDSILYDDDYLLMYVLDYKCNYLALFNINTNTIVDKLFDFKKILRPAGAIFNYNGSKVIPTQDCSINYGYGLIFNKIDVRDGRIRIHPFQRITGDTIKKYLIKSQNIIGIHTYNKNESYEIIDIARTKISFLGILGKIYYRIKLTF